MTASPPPPAPPAPPQAPTLAPCLILLAKAPVEGEVKTRLTRGVSALSAGQAACVHEAFTREVWRRLGGVADSMGTSRRLRVAGEDPLWEALSPPGAPRALPPLPQRGEDLGARMWEALSAELAEGARAALLVGADSPSLPARSLEEALRALEVATEVGLPRVTLGPAHDGGYYMVGLNAAALSRAGALFEGVSWGSERVLSETLARAERAGLDVWLTAPWYDIDTPEDLALLLRHRLTQEPRDRPRLGGPLDALELAPPATPALAAAYAAALERLYSLTRFGERMDLATPRALNAALGDPLSRVKSVIVGGTNGKGSTCAHLSALAEQASLRAGRFISPHLVSFRERISLNGRPISCERVVEGVARVFEVAAREGLTMSFFEATWALAAWYFAEEGVEWVIWEVGLGGRLDATNACEPLVSAIASVGLDHMHILGDTLEAIATEKAAISRPGRPALTGATGAGWEALRAVAPQFIPAPPLPEACERAIARLGASPSMSQNAALALGVARAAGWEVSDAAAAEALSRFEWPGRLELLRGVWLDCAHNPAAVESITPWLEARRGGGPERRVICVFGASQDKDIEGVLARLAPLVDELVWVSPQYARCARAEELSARFGHLRPSRAIPSVGGALDLLRAEPLRPDEAARPLIFVTGSCFLVGEARAHLLGLPYPEGDLHTTAR